MREIWKEIPDFNGWYLASNKGRVASFRTKSRGDKKRSEPKILNCYQNPSGYVYVKLKKGDKRSGFLVHRLVAKAFIENPHNKPHINHIDANPSNNCVENLEWCTPRENVLHCFKIGNRDHIDQKGENGNNCVLTTDEVLQIRSIYENGWFSHREIGRAYGVSGRHIGRIINKKRWGHI